MYWILVLVVFILILCNKDNIEAFTSGKCDINEEKFRLLEKRIKSQEEEQPIIINNKLCDDNSKVAREIPAPRPSNERDNQTTIMLLKEQMNENRRKEQEYNSKLNELNTKIDLLNKKEKEE